MAGRAGDAGLLETILARHAADPAAPPVTVRPAGWQEQSRMLLRGEADAALTYGPYEREGLDAEDLVAEPRVAALAVSHPLAARTGLRLADLGPREDETLRFIEEVRGRGRDLAQLLTLVGLGELVALLPASVAGRYPRPGVVYRAVLDAPAAVMAVAWLQESRSTATAAFVRAAVSVADDVRARGRLSPTGSRAARECPGGSTTASPPPRSPCATASCGGRAGRRSPSRR